MAEWHREAVTERKKTKQRKKQMFMDGTRDDWWGMGGPTSTPESSLILQAADPRRHTLTGKTQCPPRLIPLDVATRGWCGKYVKREGVKDV